MVILSLDSAIPQPVVDEIKAATEATFIKALHMQIGKCSRSCGCGV
jgi:D-3-phosphoglycerate dehydrogenase